LLKKLWQLGRSGAAFSFLTAVFGAAVAIFSATRLGFGSKSEIGSGFFPFIIGVVLVAAGLISGISSVRRRDNMTGGELQLAQNSVRRVVYTVIAYIAWLLLTPFLGYVPATFPVSIALAKTMGLERWVWPIVLSLAITLSLYLLFDVFFYVDLPRGILG
jgi:putative tricarboxylic transport membrane protein